MLHRDVCIEAVAYELPPNVVTSASLYERLSPTLKRLGIPAEGLAALSGVQERRFWDPGTPPSRMAAVAARKALEEADLDPDRLGVLINTSVCRDYVEPSTASLIHGELGLGPHCLNFDLGNACLAFLNGMSLVADMIDSGQVEAGLVVAAESSREVTEATVARLLEPDTDAARFREQFAALTLGSGAVAAVLVAGRYSRTGHRLVGQVSMADTRYCRICLGQPTEMKTDHTTLLRAGVALARRTWELACRTFGWMADRVDQFICHQVGATHQRVLFETLGLDARKAFSTFPFLGNVGPASVPLTLALAQDRGIIRPGHRLALMGIGSGLNCSMMEVIW
jgi:3-oxoacyl-[acyl-carrier-protein] synthase-3